MAEDPKIVPSPPPAEPVDVKVSPSPGPSQPFDVPTYPSPPPAEPFDVKVYPDPPPGGTFDVPTSPDGPPAETFDVPTLPDGPPSEPFDVPTAPDGPPAAPFDVQTSPDGPPGEPFDVSTTPDGPPVDPIDVGVVLDLPPAEPVDVGVVLSQQINPDGLWIGTTSIGGDSDNVQIDKNSYEIDVPLSQEIGPNQLWVGPSPSVGDSENVKIHRRAFDPATVKDNQDPGVPPLPDPIQIDDSSTLAKLASATKFFDQSLGSFLGELVESKRLTNEAIVLAADRGLPFVVNSIQDDRYIEFLAKLAQGGITDPLSTFGGTSTVTTFAEALRRPENVYSSRRQFGDGQDFAVDEMVDAAIDGQTHAFTSPVQDQPGVPAIQKFDSSKYFNDRGSDGGQSAKNLARSLPADVQSTKLAASAFTNGVVRMSVPGEIDGAIYSIDQDPSFVVDDDDTRIPVCFTDLRKDPVQNAYRSIYFRPLNLNFSKTISPEWNEGGAFGRVDPIVSYQRTNRSYSVSFELHAFAPEDLQVMYNKMVWLDSMCYPSYGADSLMKSGPVIRMRIGDVVSTEGGGLTGIIKSLSFDFADALWELKKGMKVPRSFKVSLDFLALHEGPVGILGGQFGVFQLPTPGVAGEVDTNDPGGPTDSREEPTRQATILPGRFMKFGEPRR